MFNREEFIKSIFCGLTPQQFNDLALELFQHQAESLTIYRDFIQHLGIDVKEIDSLEKIPFLPIQFFKNQKISTHSDNHQSVFRSSGTTSSSTSEHYIKDLQLYESAFLTHFESTYGSCEDLIILALLPSYLERNDSSLVYMVDHLINKTASSQSGFYLNNYEELNTTIEALKTSKKQVILFGVTFALLECSSMFSNANWSHLKIIETGGMKGRGKELTRTELHSKLKRDLNVKEISSEYGMTELLSQAYSKENIFTCPSWMKVQIREIDDPLSSLIYNKTGGINVIDLANVDSCAFIATDDLGQINDKGEFTVLGRYDHSDVRGCNLLISEN